MSNVVSRSISALDAKIRELERQLAEEEECCSFEEEEQSGNAHEPAGSNASCTSSGLSHSRPDACLATNDLFWTSRDVGKSKKRSRKPAKPKRDQEEGVIALVRKAKKERFGRSIRPNSPLPKANQRT